MIGNFEFNNNKFDIVDSKPLFQIWKGDDTYKKGDVVRYKNDDNWLTYESQLDNNINKLPNIHTKGIETLYVNPSTNWIKTKIDTTNFTQILLMPNKPITENLTPNKKILIGDASTNIYYILQITKDIEYVFDGVRTHSDIILDIYNSDNDAILYNLEAILSTAPNDVAASDIVQNHYNNIFGVDVLTESIINDVESNLKLFNITNNICILNNTTFDIYYTSTYKDSQNNVIKYPTDISGAIDEEILVNTSEPFWIRLGVDVFDIDNIIYPDLVTGRESIIAKEGIMNFAPLDRVDCDLPIIGYLPDSTPYFTIGAMKNGNMITYNDVRISVGAGYNSEYYTTTNTPSGIQGNSGIPRLNILPSFQSFADGKNYITSSTYGIYDNMGSGFKISDSYLNLSLNDIPNVEYRSNTNIGTNRSKIVFETVHLADGDASKQVGSYSRLEYKLYVDSIVKQDINTYAYDFSLNHDTKTDLINIGFISMNKSSIVINGLYTTPDSLITKFNDSINSILTRSNTYEKSKYVENFIQIIEQSTPEQIQRIKTLLGI